MILNKEQLREEAHKSALNHDPYMKRKSSKLLWSVGQSDIEDLRSLSTFCVKKDPLVHNQLKNGFWIMLSFWKNRHLVSNRS